MIDYLKNKYKRQQFYPGVLGLFVNPFYFARKGLVQNVASLAPFITGKTLDVGCGSKPYEKLYASTEYVGLEYDTPANRASKKAEFFYDGNRFPFENETFDSAVANQVFEHVFNPEEFLKELQRVLRPQGMLIMTIPFVWDEHEQPYDFARYTSFGLRNLLDRTGFEVVEQRKSIDDIRVIFQLINAYIFKKTVTKSRLMNVLVTLFLMAPFNLMGEFASILLPRNSDLYLDNIVLARKK